MLRFLLKNMAVKKGKLLLVLLSIVLTASIALLAFNVSMQVKDGIVNTAAYYDIIIGPSGSATQLAMNTMFFTDKPLGTISYDIVLELEKNPNINEAVPFAMGDSYNAAKIVGTTGALLNGKPLSEGRMFDGIYEAVIGASVAERYSLSVGDSLVTSHGLAEHGSEHEASPLTVVGILQNTHTAYDNAIFTSVETVWAVHGIAADHGDEEDEEEHAHEGTVCAVLVKTKSMNAYYAVTKAYGEDASLLVINPSTVLREVLENVDLSAQVVYILCAVILVMNLFVISVITLLNLYDAQKEIALMRLIGISMKKISLLYLLQNGIIGLTATLLALGASMGCLVAMRDFVAQRGIVLNAAAVYPLEWAIMGIVFIISVLPTCICTFVMSRKDSLGGK